MAEPSDHELAHDLATRAGELLVDLRQRAGEKRASGWALKDEGDRRAHQFLAYELAKARPGDAVLSEEGRDDLTRLGSDRVWIVDPLDGTREFGEPPREDWAVHVALVEAGVPTAGAVALPAQNVTYSTRPGGIAPVPPPAARPRLVVSRTRPLHEAILLAQSLHGDLVPMGSAGAKAMAVATGRAEVYAHAGGQYEWDSCAPVAVARAAGLVCTRMDGSELVYNRDDVWLPDVLICHPALADSVRELLASMGW